jgi:two-component system LytT family response regulator
MIKVCIIDDEESNRIVLAHFLNKYHNQEIEIIGQADKMSSGLNIINQLKPDLIFLDIEMPDGSGFDLLYQLQDVIPEIIFCTAYNQFALKAIECSALAYILKPITKDALAKAIQKAIAEAHIKNQLEQYEILKQKLNHPTNQAVKFAVSNSDGTHIIQYSKLLYCTAHSNYTAIHQDGNNKIIISKTLKEMELLLENQPSFFRIHQSNIVNLDKIKKIIRNENTITLIMSDNAELTVSRSKKEELLERLKNTVF